MRDDGGPAFPVLEPRSDYTGMSLRDYFAAMAMQGLLASDGTEFDPCDWSAREKDAALQAYKIADAMLAERAK